MHDEITQAEIDGRCSAAYYRMLRALSVEELTAIELTKAYQSTLLYARAMPKPGGTEPWQ